MAEQVFYDMARWRLDRQLEQIRELNSRLTGVFAGATALLVLFATFQDFQALAANPIGIGLGSGAIGIYVLLLLTSVIGYRDPDLHMGPALDDLNLPARSGQGDQHAAGLALSESIDANAPLLRRKSQFVFVAVALWALDVMLLLATALTAAI